VDNLEIKLSHIHFRYEDNATFPGETFSCGCTLESFLVTTTDKEWSETFKKGGHGVTSLNYKLAKSTNFGVYWNIESPEYSGLCYEEWKEVMQRCITYVPSATSVNPLQIMSPEKLTYIIQPSNFGQLKIIHDETADVVPQLSIRFESSDLKLHFDKLQMRQSMKAMFAMQAMQEKMFLWMHRPKQSAVHQPWEWWEYLLILMSNKPDLLAKRVRLDYIIALKYTMYSGVDK
jgi:hypothetical protein